MKPYKLPPSSCILLFITASDFWSRLEPSQWIILGWVFVKCSYFLKPYCNYVFKESEIWMWLSQASFLFLQILAEPCSKKGLILSSTNSLFVVVHSSENSIHYGGQPEVYLNPSWTSITVFFTKVAPSH